MNSGWVSQGAVENVKEWFLGKDTIMMLFQIEDEHVEDFI